MRLSDYVLGQPTPILMKGEPGTGKTIAAASYPNPYIFSVDKKVAAIKKYYQHQCIDPEVVSSVEYVNVRDIYTDLLAPLEELQNSCNKTVIVDTLTASSYRAIDYSVKYRPGRESSLRRGQIVLNEVEDYNVEARVLTSLVEMLKYISTTHGVYTILIAHVLETETMIGRQKVISRTLLTGAKKLAAAIPGEFDEIYHFETERPINLEDSRQFVCKTVHDGDDFARTALPIPAKINWTNQNFFKRLCESLPKENM